MGGCFIMANHNQKKMVSHLFDWKETLLVYFVMDEREGSDKHLQHR